MSEVSEIFDLNQSQIRSWERQFSSLHPRRNRKGNRIFTPEDIETIKVIYNLVVIKGLKIQSAAKQIKIEGGELHRNAQVIDKLLAIKASLLNIHANINEEIDK